MFELCPSSVSQCYKQHKPLNPILGETYQASFFDGTRIFMEQVILARFLSDSALNTVDRFSNYFLP